MGPTHCLNWITASHSREPRRRRLRPPRPGFRVRPPVRAPGRANLREEVNVRGETGHGATLELNRGHGRPGRELPHGFGDEGGRECFDSGRDGVAAANPHPIFKRGDPVHEREGAKMSVQSHTSRAAAASGRRTAPAAVAARWRRITILQKVSAVNSRGISATFSGELKRSAGISLRKTLKRSSPAAKRRPPVRTPLPRDPRAPLPQSCRADLHLERALQAENDVKEINGLRAQIVNQRRLELHLFHVTARASAMISATLGNTVRISSLVMLGGSCSVIPF